MEMFTVFSFIVILMLIIVGQGFLIPSFKPSSRFTRYSSNVDIFSSGPAFTKADETSSISNLQVSNEEKSNKGNDDDMATTFLSRDKIYKQKAERLRQEAKDMESNLIEEARARGVPEDIINQYLPQKKNNTASSDGTKSSASVPLKRISYEELMEKLQYVEIGDALKMTSAMDKLKLDRSVTLWNSKSIDGNSFSVSNSLLKIRTSIDPVQLKLDDVGYNYQNVLVVAIVLGTVLALSSSTVGGELGFILGYSSALLPIGLVGIGSIAPSLIGDALLRSKMLIDNELKERYIRWNAAKFVVGYILGLPINRYNKGGVSNSVEFFQLRPQSSQKVTSEERIKFARKKFSQLDIARSSTVCLAGAVAECIEFGNACGANSADVNLLYELLQSVDPPLQAEKIQDHIRWAAVHAHEILTSNKGAYEKVVEEFRKGSTLEEVIASLEMVSN